MHSGFSGLYWASNAGLLVFTDGAVLPKLQVFYAIRPVPGRRPDTTMMNQPRCPSYRSSPPPFTFDSTEQQTSGFVRGRNHPYLALDIIVQLNGLEAVAQMLGTFKSALYTGVLTPLSHYSPIINQSTKISDYNQSSSWFDWVHFDQK